MKNLLGVLMVVFVSVPVRAGDMDWSRQPDQDSLLSAIAASKEASPSPKAAPAAKMKPETAKFLRSIGIDPESDEIALIYSEGPVETAYQGDPQTHSLDTLAAEKAKNATKRFITTRNFIRALKQDFEKTSIPPEGYDGLYLTLEERKLALKKVFG